MWDKRDFYILQPQLDQSISLARLIRQSDSAGRVVALTRRGEGGVRVSEYDSVQEINDYIDVPEGLRVVPTGAASTEALLAVRNIVLGDIALERSALAAYDKRRFLSMCEVVGLPIPRTFHSIRDVPSDLYPLFYKEAHEQGGGKRGIAYAVEDVPRHDQGELIFQEYIDTPGTYGVGFLAKNGELLVSFSHFERESYPVTGGSAVLIESINDPVLIALTSEVVKAMDYSGWGLAEFKYSRLSKSYVFMEVNAKFWASCEVAFSSQPEFAKRLFGIHVEAAPAKRWFFINRGLAHGLVYMLSRAHLVLSSKLVVMPGLGRALLGSFVPEALKALLRVRSAPSLPDSSL